MINWLLRWLVVRSAIAELLLGPTDKELGNRAKQLAQRILDAGVRSEKLRMPLALNVTSDTEDAPFFNGVGTQVMRGSFVTDDSLIGSYTYVGFNSLVCKATVGRYVSIADGVSIGPGEHGLGNISTSSIFYEPSGTYDDLTRDKVEIDHDAWIGTGSVIRRGVHVGIGAVVGANSFVNKNVPPFAIVGGSPAKIISYRFSEERIAEILQSKWWDLPLSQARQKLAAMQATEEPPGA